MPISVDRYEAVAEEVLAIYEEAEQVMMHRVAKRLLRGINVPGWTERKYGEVQAVVKEMRDYMAGVSKHRREVQKQGITDAYNGSRDAFINEAKQFTNVVGIRGLTANTSKVARIMAELDRSMNAADRKILRTVDDAYTGIIGRASALVGTGTITYRDAVKRELDEFANRGISSFVDKAGRVWDMETYSEMATLTAIERASREGYTDTMQEYGFDLAMISDHYGACPICEAWQNVVISINGNSPKYPSLADAEAAGVFHPRCLHDLSTYFEGITPGGREKPGDVQPPNAGYTARSQQRALERQVRKWKRRMAVAGSPEEERKAYARVRMYQQKIRELVRDYNDSTPSNVDHLPRKYWREGGRVNLSAAAKRIKPVQINSSKPKPETQAEERKPLTRMERILYTIQRHQGEWSVQQLQEVGGMIAEEHESRFESYAQEVQKQLDSLKKESDELIDRLEAMEERAFDILMNGDLKAQRQFSKERDKIAERIDEIRELRGNLTRGRKESLLRTIMSEIRPLGGVTKDNVTQYADFNEYRTQVKKTKQAAIDAMNYYPSSWLKASMDRTLTLKPHWTTSRAYYWDYNGEIRFDGSLGTGVHELMHRFEHTIESVILSEKQFYDKRTQGESLEWIGQGYSKNEKTRRDNFLHVYMGKDYGGRAFELLSMGVQYAYTNYDWLEKDKDMQTWVFGVLAAL